MIAALIPFATTEMVTVRAFGVGIAIAVALDAFIVRPVLLPAAVEVMGRWSWWPTVCHGPIVRATTDGKTAGRPDGRAGAPA
jgi:RND superfamily putative drug exporter